MDWAALPQELVVTVCAHAVQPQQGYLWPFAALRLTCKNFRNTLCLPSDAAALYITAPIRNDRDIIRLLLRQVPYISTASILAIIRMLGSSCTAAGAEALLSTASWGGAVKDLIQLAPPVRRLCKSTAILHTGMWGLCDHPLDVIVEGLVVFRDHYFMTKEMLLSPFGDNSAFFVSACREGKDVLLTALHSVFSLTTLDARRDNGSALLKACDSDNPKVLEVLHDVYGLTAVDVRAHGNKAFLIACKSPSGRASLGVLRKVFGMGTEDACHGGGQALLAACGSFSAENLEALHSLFGLRKAHVLGIANKAIYAACACYRNPAEVLKGLVNVYGFTADMIDSKAKLIHFTLQCKEPGNALQALHTHFGLTVADVTALLSDMCRTMHFYQCIPVLLDHYGLSRDEFLRNTEVILHTIYAGHQRLEAELLFRKLLAADVVVEQKEKVMLMACKSRDADCLRALAEHYNFADIDWSNHKSTLLAAAGHSDGHSYGTLAEAYGWSKGDISSRQWLRVFKAIATGWRSIGLRERLLVDLKKAFQLTRDDVVASCAFLEPGDSWRPKKDSAFKVVFELW